MKKYDLNLMNSKSFSSEERLQNAAEIGFRPQNIFDVGAYQGVWTKKVSDIFPNATFVLIEPNDDLVKIISTNTKHLASQAVLVQAAVGNKNGKAKLNIWKNPAHNNETVALAASSLLDHVQGAANKVTEVELLTLDSVAQQRGRFPDLLKLDLQGGELDALLGAKECLRHAEMSIIEFGRLDAYLNRTTPYDVMRIMYESDFVLYDVVDLRYRPYDGGFVGGDFFFVKKDSNLKSHRDYF